MRDPAHVPELDDDLAARGVDRVGHAPPAGQLFFRIQAGHVGIALALVADGRGFRDQQAGAGALAVIGGRDGQGYGARRPVAGQRGHDDAVGELQVADGDGVVQRGHRESWLGGEAKYIDESRILYR